jgi:hypothetical protein
MSTAPARTSRRFMPDRDVAEWTGPYAPYDLVKEFLVAMAVVVLLVVALAVLFGSPDDTPVTIRTWSTATAFTNPDTGARAPGLVDFAQTAITELDGSSGTATYGPPYNASTDPGPKLGPLALQHWAGVHHPIDTAQDFVLGPLSTQTGNAAVQAAVARYRNATPDQQAAWDKAYEDAVAKATVVDGRLVVPAGAYGPVGTIISGLTSMASSGALDGALVSSRQFYGTDYTAPLLFIAGGAYLSSLARAQHLGGDQWGMMNETGSYPGQAWLWLYTLWYQVPAIGSSANADVWVFGIMIALTLLLALVPFIPGLRSIPRWSRVYRIIWRTYYREAEPNRVRTT